MLVRFRDQIETPGGDMDWACFVRMQHDAVGALECFHFDFGLLDRAHVHARLEPAFKEDRVETVARTHRYIGAADRFFRLADRLHFYAQHRTHLLRKRFATGLGRAETANRFDIAHGARGHQLCARLPAGAENADRARILARQIFHSKPIGSPDPHALHDAGAR